MTVIVAVVEMAIVTDGDFVPQRGVTTAMTMVIVMVNSETVTGYEIMAKVIATVMVSREIWQ